LAKRKVLDGELRQEPRVTGVPLPGTSEVAVRHWVPNLTWWPMAGEDVAEAEGDAEALVVGEIVVVGELLSESMYQTGSQFTHCSRQSGRPTLIGIAGSTLVGLHAVVPFVETLVTASLGDAVVVCEVPSLLR
jgi:hypothetical protein